MPAECGRIIRAGHRTDRQRPLLHRHVSVYGREQRMHPMCPGSFPDRVGLHRVQRMSSRVPPAQQGGHSLQPMREREILVGGGKHGLPVLRARLLSVSCGEYGVLKMRARLLPGQAWAGSLRHVSTGAVPAWKRQSALSGMPGGCVPGAGGVHWLCRLPRRDISKSERRFPSPELHRLSGGHIR